MIESGFLYIALYLKACSHGGELPLTAVQPGWYDVLLTRIGIGGKRVYNRPQQP